MNRRKLSACVVLISLFLSSCARERHLITLDDFAHDRGANAAPVLAQIAAKQKQLVNMRARFRVVAQETLGKKSFTQSVIYSAPDHLRVDTFATAMNKLIALLVAADGELRVFDLEQSIGYRGEAKRANLQATTGFPFSVQEAAFWFCGQFFVPDQEEIEFSRIRRTRDQKNILLEVRTIDGQEYWLELEADEGDSQLRLKTLELWAGGGKELIFTTQFSYDPRQEIKSGEFSPPMKFSVNFPGKKLRVEFESESYLLNGPQTSIRPQIFEVQFPPQMEVRDLK